jgi:NAD(P)-dependent dehydrogenase (short-subunit alcohol dehydrogenase family)
MPASRELAGKVAIITGAARNLGRGFAVALARQGADIVVHYHSPGSKEDAEETARLVQEQDARAVLVSGDLAAAVTAKRLFDEAANAFKRVDILINSAGLIIKKPFTEISESDFDRIYAINAKGPFFCMQEAARRLNDGGRIINIGTSLLGASYPFYAIYAGSKASLEHFSRDLALQLRSRQITVNTIAPGALDTPFFYAAETPDSIAFTKQMTGGLGKVDDVAPVVEFLASPGAHWVTGQTIFVNGGLLTR